MFALYGWLIADVLYGRNAVREALRAGRRSFERLTVSAGAQEAGTLGEVIRLAEKADVPIVRVDRHELDRKLRDANHQGVALECGEYPYAELSDCLELAAERQEPALREAFAALALPGRRAAWPVRTVLAPARPSESRVRVKASTRRVRSVACMTPTATACRTARTDGSSRECWNDSSRTSVRTYGCSCWW